MSSTVYEITGVVFRIDDELSFAEGRFKKQAFIIMDQSNYGGKSYTDYIELECHNEGIYQTTGMCEGQKVAVKFVIQGKEAKAEHLKGRYFNTLKAIKIDILEDISTEQRAADTAKDTTKQETDSFVESNIDDLPFILTIPLAIGFLMQFMI